MSMFRSAADISSSDPESSSDESESESIPAKERPSNNEPSEIEDKKLLNTLDEMAENQENESESINPRSGQELGAALDLDADGHATVMTSALLEFYCLTRAVDILNAQSGSHGKFTRDSPEVKYLGKKLYSYKSQFLSAHGVMAGGIDSEDWGSTRQYYRDSLDMLGASALEGANLGTAAGQPPSRGAIKDSVKPRNPSSRQLVGRDNHVSGNSETQNRGAWELQKRIPENENVTGHVEHRVNLTNLLQLPPALSSDSKESFPIPNTHLGAFNDQLSRYAMEYTEIKMLGRGSFGHVYEVRNHVDGQNYAVKKIPLSQWRLEMLQQGGIHHIEHIMKEIRTLARLEHANVVRYYGAWVEHAHSFPEQQPLEESQSVQTKLLAEDPAEEEQSFGVVFEHSEDAVFADDAASNSTHPRTDSTAGERIERRRSSRLTNVSNRSKRSSTYSLGTDEDDVESIPRNFSIPARGLTSTWGDTEGDIFTDGLSEEPSKMQLKCRDGSQAPAVILHIQMSLHPLTLSTYLNPQTSVRNRIDQSPSPRHCFHLMPSLKILLGILSGVEYLHSTGIVHRDLKPANIFLSIRDDGHDACMKCKVENGSLKFPSLPRIGDFGLVADISRCTDSSTNTNSTIVVHDSPRKIRHVGTEFYCPPISNARYATGNFRGAPSGDQPTNHTIDEKLDVFALGVILFELVYLLNTKMERQMVLFGLTRGMNPGVSLPTDFATKVDYGSVSLENGKSVADSLSTCIKGMLEPNPKKRWKCRDVRQCLENLASMVEKHSV